MQHVLEWTHLDGYKLGGTPGWVGMEIVARYCKGLQAG